jgi:hypothetical protein
MRFSLTSFVRLAALLGLALFASAVGLSRAVPRPPVVRTAAPPRYYGVNGGLFCPPVDRGYLLDAESGRLLPFDPVPGSKVEYAASSPWRDAAGDVEILARVSPRSDRYGRSAFEPGGLARFRLSGGPLRLTTPGSPVVAGRPCWLPGSSARVLFPGGDGLLYVQELRNDDTPEADAYATPPRPVAWRERLPGEGRHIVFDVAGPAVPALGGRVLVSFSPGWKAVAGVRIGAPEVWWLSLDAAGASVLAARRLTPPGPGADRGAGPFERLPNLGVAPDGRVVLAYLTREASSPVWRLKLAPVHFEGPNGDPVVRPSDVRDLGGDGAAATPVFSADGRWLFQVTRTPSHGECVRRVSVPDALAGSPIPRDGSGPAD